MNTKKQNNMYDIVSFEENIVNELEFVKIQASSLLGEARRAKREGRKIDLGYFEEKINKSQGALGAAFSFAFKRNLRLEEVSN